MPQEVYQSTELRLLLYHWVQNVYTTKDATLEINNLLLTAVCMNITKGLFKHEKVHLTKNGIISGGEEFQFYCIFVLMCFLFSLLQLRVFSPTFTLTGTTYSLTLHSKDEKIKFYLNIWLIFSLSVWKQGLMNAISVIVGDGSMNFSSTSHYVLQKGCDCESGFHSPYKHTDTIAHSSSQQIKEEFLIIKTVKQ